MFKLNFRKLLILISVIAVLSGSVAAQAYPKPRRAKVSAICGNPAVRCNTSVPFEPHDLPFRVPKNAVIFDTELFYVVILKSVAANEDDCDTFVAESERMTAQALFPDRKVFTSRCMEPGNLFYTNISDKHRIMAVYAGSTLAESRQVLEAVKASGKFPGAFVRRTRTGFNGT
ncbi:MAG TPA: hypothetical protein VMZ30_06325 [Pyrinomonadaceae bacterium]|nr:hypothetical protein [Pyrinomonadaceae bacterium]